MIKSLIPVLALVTGTFAPAVSAQEASESNEPQPAATPTLDLGQPVTDTQALGARYAKSTHGDWELACIRTENEDQDPCSLLQIMNGPQGNPMAEMSMFRLKGQGQAVAGATIIVPLESLLPAQLTISIDGAPGKRYNYTFCNPVGCVAQIGLTQLDIDAMKAGSEATITLVPAPAPDQRIDLKLSLKGFTAGYDVVDVVEN